MCGSQTERERKKKRPLVDAPHNTSGRPQRELGGQHDLQQEQVGLLQLWVSRCITLTQSIQLVTGHPSDLCMCRRVKRQTDNFRAKLNITTLTVILF